MRIESMEEANEWIDYLTKEIEVRDKMIESLFKEIRRLKEIKNE